MTVLAVVLGVALAACGKREPPDQPRTRKSPLVLLQEPGSPECRVYGADEVRGYRGDTIEWPVSYHCSGTHQIGIAFKRATPGSTTFLSCEDATKGQNPTQPCTLSLVVDAIPDRYDYALQVDHSTQVDPRLEIDPHK
jgi:hypothetical protein